MAEEVRVYAEKRIQESGIRMVLGHYPDFKSKEHVDQWLKMVTQTIKAKELAEFIDPAELTDVDLGRYQELLGRLKRNKENVPIELLRTKYQKAYDQLKEELKVMTERIIWDIVLPGLMIERVCAVDVYDEINKVIKELKLFERISCAVYQKQDMNLILEYTVSLRETVHQAVAEFAERSADER